VPFALLTGGKGGVGKTTLCANLGVQLAAGGKRVLLVDLDLGLANLGVFLRLNPAHNVEDYLAGELSLADCVVRGPGGVDLLPAGSGTPDMARPDHARRERLLDGLVELSRDYDVVLGDSAAGIGPDVLAFAALAELVLVTTTPDPASLTDAFGLVKALDAWATERGREVPTPELVVNLARGGEEARTIAERMRAVCERFLARSPRMAGWLPRSKDVAGAVLRQEPFARGAGESLAARRLEGLAERISRLLPEGRRRVSGSNAGGGR
jgi:flagellar biosynthesis protein FlhG